MAQINPEITIRPVYFGMLLLSAVVMVLTVRLTVASELDSLEVASEQDSLKAAAEQGDAWAQLSLGYMYADGEGVPQNDTEAVRWYRMAAEQGNAWAQTILGFMYATGEGVSENDAEAVRWYRMAAEQGNAWAQRWSWKCLTVQPTWRVRYCSSTHSIRSAGTRCADALSSLRSNNPSRPSSS